MKRILLKLSGERLQEIKKQDLMSLQCWQWQDK